MEEKEWKFGKGWKGSTKAAIDHHPDKFDPECKDKNKLCPYAIFAAMKKKGYKSHYKDQKSTLKGKPQKFKEWLEQSEAYRKGYWLIIGREGLPDIHYDPEEIDLGGITGDYSWNYENNNVRYSHKQFDDLESAIKGFQDELNARDANLVRIILTYYGGTINHATDIVYWNYTGKFVWNPKFKQYSNFLQEPKIQTATDMYDKFIKTNKADNYQGKTYIS